MLCQHCFMNTRSLCTLTREINFRTNQISIGITQTLTPLTSRYKGEMSRVSLLLAESKWDFRTDRVWAWLSDHDSIWNPFTVSGTPLTCTRRYVLVCTGLYLSMYQLEIRVGFLVHTSMYWHNPNLRGRLRQQYRRAAVRTILYHLVPPCTNTWGGWPKNHTVHHDTAKGYIRSIRWTIRPSH